MAAGLCCAIDAEAVIVIQPSIIILFIFFVLMLKNEREMLFEERGNWSSPSLRRHYPDQVFGYYLSRFLISFHSEFSNDRYRDQHPGNAETYSVIL
jgi:hypothetical protein